MTVFKSLATPEITTRYHLAKKEKKKEERVGSRARVRYIWKGPASTPHHLPVSVRAECGVHDCKITKFRGVIHHLFSCEAQARELCRAFSHVFRHKRSLRFQAIKHFEAYSEVECFVLELRVSECFKLGLYKTFKGTK